MFLSPILHWFQKGKFYFLPPRLETYTLVTYTPVVTCAGVSTTSWLACESVTLWWAQMKRYARYISFQFQSIRDAFSVLWKPDNTYLYDQCIVVWIFTCSFLTTRKNIECHQTYCYITKLMNTWVWGFCVSPKCIAARQMLVVMRNNTKMGDVIWLPAAGLSSLSYHRVKGLPPGYYAYVSTTTGLLRSKLAGQIIENC